MCLLYDIYVVIIFATYMFLFLSFQLWSICRRSSLSRLLQWPLAQSQSLDWIADAFNDSLLALYSCSSGCPIPKPSRQTRRTTRSVAEVTKTKTFRPKTLCNHGAVSNIEAGISLISNWLPLVPYSWAGTIFSFNFIKNSYVRLFIEQFHSLCFNHSASGTVVF